MSRVTDIASRMIKNNPNIQQTPLAQAGINAILNNDVEESQWSTKVIFIQ